MLHTMTPKCKIISHFFGGNVFYRLVRLTEVDSMSNDNEAERRRLNNQLERDNAKLAECRATNQVLDEKIGRLREAYNTLGEIKSQYLTIKRNEATQLLERNPEKWEGCKHYQYREERNNRYVDGIKNGSNDYYKDIDKIQDAINMKICELENQKFSDSFIGGLIKGINSLRYQIQNLFN